MTTDRLDLAFRPTRCPYPDCPSAQGQPFLWIRKGLYTREIDRRTVQRFLCRTCRRTFSSQAFRLDFRYRRPFLHLDLFFALVSKCSLRQAARTLGCHRSTIARRLPGLAAQAQELHAALLARHLCAGGLAGTFQLDELETFEQSRRVLPVTVPVLIEKDSGFVVHVATATLPARGRLSPGDQQRKLRYEAQFGPRTNGSRAAVAECFQVLASSSLPETRLFIQTDMKKSYPPILREVLGQRFDHHLEHSSTRRDTSNLLFRINHTLAMTRDGLGRLVRRNWGYSKRRRNLGWHLWIWVLYRNYVREAKVKERWRSAAMALGIAPRRYGARELLEWRGRIGCAA